jgi:hypothetical protein
MNNKRKKVLMLEYLLLKLAFFAFTATVVLPILKVYIQEKARQRAKEKKNPSMNFTELKELKGIYEQERKPYYLEARQLFNELCKQGRMHHEDVVLLKRLLEESLGAFVEEYKGYKFQNEYNRIYVYLKNWHIDVPDWERILNFLNELYEESEVETI